MSIRPQRIQLRRTKGWRMPPSTISVARPGKWGNPYVIGGVIWRTKGFGKIRDAKEAVALFRRRLFLTGEDIAELRGKNLACWCKPGDPCHADVLLELANQPVALVKKGTT